MLNAVII